jgi:hypothetical protein
MMQKYKEHTVKGESIPAGGQVSTTFSFPRLAHLIGLRANTVDACDLLLQYEGEGGEDAKTFKRVSIGGAGFQKVVGSERSDHILIPVGAEVKYEAKDQSGGGTNLYLRADFAVDAPAAS